MDTRTSADCHTRLCVDYPLALASGFLATLAMTTVSYAMLPLLGWSQVDVSFWTARTIYGGRARLCRPGDDDAPARRAHLRVPIRQAVRAEADAVALGVRVGQQWAARALGVRAGRCGAAAGRAGIAPHGAAPAASPGWLALRLGVGPCHLQPGGAPRIRPRPLARLRPPMLDGRRSSHARVDRAGRRGRNSSLALRTYPSGPDRPQSAEAPPRYRAPRAVDGYRFAAHSS